MVPCQQWQFIQISLKFIFFTRHITNDSLHKCVIVGKRCRNLMGKKRRTELIDLAADNKLLRYNYDCMQSAIKTVIKWREQQQKVH